MGLTFHKGVYLMAPAVRPAINCFCNATYTQTIGAIEVISVANSWGNCVWYWLTKKAWRPSGNVCRFGLWIKTKAKKNSFQAWTNVKIVTVAMIGRANGKMTKTKVRKL